MIKKYLKIIIINLKKNIYLYLIVIYLFEIIIYILKYNYYIFKRRVFEIKLIIIYNNFYYEIAKIIYRKIAKFFLLFNI